MIARIFFDLDETLIHTSVYEHEQEHKSFCLEGDLNTYHTIFRPCAKKIIEFARELVGQNNVYILTVATREYALEVNRLGGFDFRKDQIFSREDLELHSFPMAYGASATQPCKAIANPNNVLVDNLDPKFNEKKIVFLGIGKTFANNYLHVKNYFGVNFPDDSFERDVKDFLIDRFNDLCDDSACERES